MLCWNKLLLNYRLLHWPQLCPEYQQLLFLLLSVQTKETLFSPCCALTENAGLSWTALTSCLVRWDLPTLAVTYQQRRKGNKVFKWLLVFVLWSKLPLRQKERKTGKLWNLQDNEPKSCFLLKAGLLNYITNKNQKTRTFDWLTWSELSRHSGEAENCIS